MTITEQLIELAQERYPAIKPVGGRRNMEECITEEEHFYALWFDTPDKSTHIVRLDKV